MPEYIDDKYAAVNGVLLSYNSSTFETSDVDISLKLPIRLGDMAIESIADGAVMEAVDLQQLIVPNGIRHIGSKAFSGCYMLTDVYIPFSVTSVSDAAFLMCPKLTNLYYYDVELSEQEYQQLLHGSRLANGSIYVSNCFPSIRGLGNIIESTDFEPAGNIQSGITRLFTSGDIKEDSGAASFKRNLGGFDFENRKAYSTETDEFMRLIGDNRPFEGDPVSERKNDEFLKKETYPHVRKTAVFTFDDSKTKYEEGKYKIFAHIKFGYHFWQSKMPIVLSGKTYYLYRRHYLYPDPTIEYIRKDAAIFSENGLVTKFEEAQTAYAKYRLIDFF